ncbi:Hypothetical protein D9617_20g027380 [Elsinoe fawcettii]|nr:Hypothetical protein D9617_20g027380 [Elsinoe fawcettii]
MPPISGPNQWFDGATPQMALSHHRQSLQHVKISYLPCVLPVELQHVYPQIDWDEFVALRKLELPSNFLFSSISVVEQAPSGATGSHARAVPMPTFPASLEELRISS